MRLFYLHPDPQTLAFFLLEKSKGSSPQKSQGFSLRGTPKILGKGRNNAQKKQGKSENEKSKEIEESKDWRVLEKSPKIPEKLKKSPI